MSRALAVTGRFPWLRLVTYDAPAAVILSNKPQASTRFVVLPDGRVGCVDHVKQNGGFLAVRPLHPITGEYLPNTAAHWSAADRFRIPEEIAVDPELVHDASRDQLPRAFR